MNRPLRSLAVVLAAAFVFPVVAADAYLPNPLSGATGSRNGPSVDASCATSDQRCKVETRSYTQVSTGINTRVAFTVGGQYGFELGGAADSAFMSLAASGGGSEDVHCTYSCAGYLRSNVVTDRGSTVVVSGNVYWCDWWCWIRKDYPYATTVEVV